MADEPALNDYLQHELDEARPDSSGVFTLSPQEALRKLAGFQLPSPHTWTTMVQAAVAAGATQISLRLLNNETAFYVKGPIAWECKKVEQAFLTPRPGDDRALLHLKQGLWSIGLQAQRPFSLQVAGRPEVLIWNGQSLRRKEATPLDLTVLVVQHRSSRDPKSLNSLLGLDCSARNAGILREIKARCFVCPVPLDVDAMRLDALQLCPGHGHNGTSCLLQVGFVQGELPPVGYPPASSGGYAPDPKARQEFSSAYQPPPQIPDQASLFSLLATHLERHPGAKDERLRTCSRPSAIYWVLDGAVLECTELTLPARACSVGLIASAEGLGTDLSGFKLQQDQAFEERRLQLINQAAPLVAAARADFSQFLSATRTSERNRDIGIGVAGMGFLFFVPHFGLMLLGMGLACHFLISDIAGQLVKDIQQELSLLQADWPPPP